MHRDLSQPSHSNIVEGTLPLEAAIRSLYSLPLAVERLLCRGFDSLGECLFVAGEWVNDRLRSVLPSNQCPESRTGITLVSYDVRRMKLAISRPSFSKKVGAPLRIMDVARRVYRRSPCGILGFLGIGTLN